MLLFEEGEFFGEQDGPLVRNVQTGEAIFAALVEGILSKRDRVATGEGAKDLANVVQVLAEGITRPDGQLLKQVVGAEFRLEPIVVGEAAIGAIANYAQCAVLATSSRVNGLPWSQHDLRSSARCYSGGYKVREVARQISNKRIGV